jgi:hypothetical protein
MAFRIIKEMEFKCQAETASVAAVCDRRNRLDNDAHRAPLKAPWRTIFALFESPASHPLPATAAEQLAAHTMIIQRLAIYTQRLTNARTILLFNINH